jgi:hypothetical protein
MGSYSFISNSICRFASWTTPHTRVIGKPSTGNIVSLAIASLCTSKLIAIHQSIGYLDLLGTNKHHPCYDSGAAVIHHQPDQCITCFTT